MTAIALIPARAGSVRLPGKNVRRLHGHPLIAYTIRSAADSGVFDRVLVSTDSEETAAIARYYGAEVPFLRPAELATAASPDIEWMRHAIDRLGAQGEHPSVVSLLRPTSPLRQPASIAEAMRRFTATEEFDSLRAVSKCAQHPMKMWTLDQDGQTLHPLLGLGDQPVPGHSRPYETLPPVYVQDASLEIAWTRTITDLGSIAGDRVMAWLTPYPEGVDVNSAADWAHLEDILRTSPDALPLVDRAPYEEGGQR
jgi:N-acylneuraminate cytidylyltransferase